MTDTFALDPDTDDPRLLAQVASYYHARLNESPEAIAYLTARGVTSEAVQHFRLGHADRTLGLQLPSKQVKAGQAIRGRLEKLGLFRASSGHEHFNGCIVFPISAADGTGQLVDLYGRKLGKKLRPGTALDLYLGEHRRGVWNVEGLAGEEVILCPSVFDALTFWCQGYCQVTTTFGSDVPTDDHLAAFAEFNVKRVLVVSEKAIPRLLNAGLDCYRLRLSPDQSVEAYPQQADDPAEALAALLRSAEWLGDGEPVPITTKPRPIQATSPITPSELEPLADIDPMPADVVERPQTEMSEPAIGAAASVAATPPMEAVVKDDEVLLTVSNRRYRVRGLQKNLSFDTLKVNVLASNATGLFVDTFDLYSARHRKAFIVQVAQELGVKEQAIKKDIGRVLLQLEGLQEQQIAATLQPKAPTHLMTDAERDDALLLLHDPHLLDRITADFEIVGEAANKLLGYLAAISRKLDEPLAVIVQSSSAAGKTALMDAVLSFVPPEDLVKYSAMTGQSLFYMGETNLKHKILAIVEEEGAERASYALKLLQSEGELTIASTGKEASTGRLVTQEYRVRGPVMIFLTTTSVQVDEELLNRSLLLTVNEDREQTQAIHQLQRQRQTLQGLLARQDRQRTLTLHRNAQRLLRPLIVANPYAEQLTFLDDKTRTRRDHAKYLTLIQAVTLLRQYQRPVKTIEHQGRQVEYVEVIPEDIAVANRLAHEVLGRSLDELPPRTRCLLGLIDDMVTTTCQEQGPDRSDYRFSRREVREHTGWGHTQLKVHLKRLEELEYLLVHRGDRGRSFVYELLYEKPAKDEKRFLSRLIDVDKLRRQQAEDESNRSVLGRGQNGVESALGRACENDTTSTPSTTLRAVSAESLENAHRDRKS